MPPEVIEYFVTLLGQNVCAFWILKMKGNLKSSRTLHDTCVYKR